MVNGNVSEQALPKGSRHGLKDDFLAWAPWYTRLRIDRRAGTFQKLPTLKRGVRSMNGYAKLQM